MSRPAVAHADYTASRPAKSNRIPRPACIRVDESRARSFAAWPDVSRESHTTSACGVWSRRRRSRRSGARPSHGGRVSRDVRPIRSDRDSDVATPHRGRYRASRRPHLARSIVPTGRRRIVTAVCRKASRRLPHAEVGVARVSGTPSSGDQRGQRFGRSVGGKPLCAKARAPRVVIHTRPTRASGPSSSVGRCGSDGHGQPNSSCESRNSRDAAAIAVPRRPAAVPVETCPHIHRLSTAGGWSRNPRPMA
jgi:hypothetical protein